MAKPNYRQAKRQKELAKKAKHQAKQQRRTEPREGEDPGSQLPAGETELKTGDSRTDKGTGDIP